MRHEGTRVGRLARLAIAASVLLAAPTLVAGAAEHIYAGQYSSTAFSGVDGYIRVSGTNMVDGNNNFHATFVNLCVTTSCGQWVQVGQFQGTIGTGTCPGSACVRSTTYVHGYFENYLWCGEYDIDDTGDEHLDPNVPYYVSRVGTGVSSCDDTDEKYAFRSDSYTNPPDGYGYLTASTGIPIAETELYHQIGDGEPLGQDRVGLNDNNQVNDSFGLHVLSAGNWLLWSPSNAPGSQQFDDDPPYYYSVKQYSAFRTDDQ
jgi:hypothetical protein